MRMLRKTPLFDWLISGIILFICYACSQSTESTDRNKLAGNMGDSPQVQTFTDDLSQGIFFKTASPYFVLIHKEHIYFIGENQPDEHLWFMFHMVRPDGSFANLDFQWKRQGAIGLKTLKGSRIYAVKLPFVFRDYIAMRIGEYQRLDNNPEIKWVQRIELEPVFNNELLRYEGEWDR